jgi:hypothetical protein
MESVRRVRLLVLAFVMTAFASAYAGQDKVEVCHVTASGYSHTILIAEPAVAAHLNHGDTLGVCGATTGVCPCSDPRVWQLFPFGGLYCAANVSGGRLSVCTADGQPTCVAFAGDGSALPLEDCAACLPAQWNATTINSCAEVPGYLP